MDSLVSDTFPALLLIGILVCLAVVFAAFMVFSRKKQVQHQSNFENNSRRLGFKRIEWNDVLREKYESLDISPESGLAQGSIFQLQRSDADFYLIEGSLMSSARVAGYQNSMLVISSTLGLPRMATIPRLHFEGLIGRLFDEFMEHTPMGAMQPVELGESEQFHLFALNPMQAKAFFDGWRMAQLSELSEGFVSCDGDAFICALMPVRSNMFQHSTSSGGINRLYDFAQQLLAGFVN